MGYPTVIEESDEWCQNLPNSQSCKGYL